MRWPLISVLKYSPNKTGSPLICPKRDLRKVALSYEATNLSPVVGKVALNAFYQNVDRVFDSDIAAGSFPMLIDINAYSEDAQETMGLNGKVESSFGRASRTVFGSEYVDDAVDTDKTTTTQITNQITSSVITTQRIGHDEAGIKTLARYG